MKYPNASPTLTFTEAINRAANNLLNINGRSRRSEFWWTKLVTFFLAMIFGFGILLDLLTIPLTVRRLHDTGRSGWWLLGSIILSVIFFGIACYDLVALFIDASNGTFNNFGLFSLLMKYIVLTIVFIIYQIIIIAFCCIDSDPYPNKYGESPKYSFDNE
ncbi:Uncharacterized membrane protein YhaH, DUF805 family [Bacteroidales bacterium KHT7]|nr:Uncharacterized membrane protein YhaH, DUF805 family [Bacteroidales bacterium KHT7]